MLIYPFHIQNLLSGLIPCEFIHSFHYSKKKKENMLVGINSRELYSRQRFKDKHVAKNGNAVL